MKRIAIKIMCGVLVLAVIFGIGFRAGNVAAQKAYKEKEQKMVQSEQKLIIETPKEVKRPESTTDPTAQATPEPEPTKVPEKKETKSLEKPEKNIQETPKEIQTEIEVSNEYEFIGFEAVYEAFATPDQIKVVKNDVAAFLEKSEYKDVQTVTLSGYTQVEEKDTRVHTYAKAGDKAILEIVYSVRFGKNSVKISEYTPEELKQLETYGTITGVTTESVKEGGTSNE